MWKNLKKGDKAVVRTFEDLRTEFPVSGSTVMTRHGFVSNMHRFSGAVVTIKSFRPDYSSGYQGSSCFLEFMDPKLQKDADK